MSLSVNGGDEVVDGDWQRIVPMRDSGSNEENEASVAEEEDAEEVVASG